MAYGSILIRVLCSSSSATPAFQKEIGDIHAAGQAQAADWNIIMAGTIIVMLPPLIILFVMQSSLVKGFSMQEEK